MKKRQKKSIARYPWDNWFSHRITHLVRGTHFEGQPHGMAQTARQAAIRMGVSISIDIQDEVVTITVRNGKEK